MTMSGGRPGDVGRVGGAGHGDVEQATLLGDGEVGDGRDVGREPGLDPGKDHDGPFEPLRTVEGGERHGIARPDTVGRDGDSGRAERSGEASDVGPSSGEHGDVTQRDAGPAVLGDDADEAFGLGLLVAEPGDVGAAAAASRARRGDAERDGGGIDDLGRAAVGRGERHRHHTRDAVFE